MQYSRHHLVSSTSDDAGRSSCLWQTYKSDGLRATRMLSGILKRALAETFLDIGNNTSDRGYVFSNPTTRLLDEERDDMNMDSVALLETLGALIHGSVLGGPPPLRVVY